ncbi:DUF72 domain-containing protein [Chondromyces apiculatus]|uniref:DUF72 domain-containing protein n=1 Tax=Chondromyces apiculatus DSM 436 TaxID=1192034 RepID=A0A017T7N5_9BACT|nr:DUF72 domain-containing protein [Chondromyces apiculatus]EYF05283.1 Hypothetical protein CAP_3424 [Chondromyces apiculatus DSM 436]
MARVLVGLPEFQGKIEKYKDRFDMVEIRPVDTSVPRPPTLRRWRKAVPPTFVFSVILPRVVGALAAGAELDTALASALGVAATLEARCIVLQTPPDVRPTAANRKKIADLFARIPPEGVVRAWEPSGIWEAEDVIATARAAGVLPIFDAARDDLPSGPIVYTRLRALGKSSSLSEASLQRVADALRGRREAFVIVEGRGGTRTRQALLTATARSRAELGDAGTVRPVIMPMTLKAEDEEQ